MFKQKPFIFSLFVLTVLISLHLVGSYYSFYWIYPRFDFFVHLVSGLWVGLVILWLASCFGQISSLKEYKLKSFLIAFVSAVVFGVAWEILENLSQITFIDTPGYNWNTALDLFGDALGGVLAFLYFVKRKKQIEVSADTLHPFYNQTGIIKS